MRRQTSLWRGWAGLHLERQRRLSLISCERIAFLVRSLRSALRTALDIALRSALRSALDIALRTALGSALRIAIRMRSPTVLGSHSDRGELLLHIPLSIA